MERDEEKAKKIKNKKKEIKKGKRKVGSHKIETGAEGALTEGCRKQKAEICSVKKDGAAGDCWPVKPGGRLLADGMLCGLYEKMRGGSLTAKQIKLRMLRLLCHVGRRSSLSQLNPAAIEQPLLADINNTKKRKDKK